MPMKKLDDIYDADACPVKAEAEQIITNSHQLSLVIVSNGGIRPSPNPLVQLVIVAEGPDVADKYIADTAKAGDIVVTGDIPLAARVIGNNVTAIRHNGDVFTTDNIGGQLATRDLMADLRAADPFLVQSNRKVEPLLFLIRIVLGSVIPLKQQSREIKNEIS